MSISLTEAKALSKAALATTELKITEQFDKLIERIDRSITYQAKQGYQTCTINSDKLFDGSGRGDDSWGHADYILRRKFLKRIVQHYKTIGYKVIGDWETEASVIRIDWTENN